MDTHTLVKTQVEDAERWLSQLKNDGFPVRAAFWAKGADEERWSFYLASPALEEVGTLKAIRQALQALRKLGDVSFRGSDVLTLVSDKDSIVQDVLDFQKRFPELTRKKLKGQPLGRTTMDVYIYPLGEIPLTIYGMIYRGEPTGSLHLSFTPFGPQKDSSLIVTGASGIVSEFPAETGLDFLVAVPEGAKLERELPVEPLDLVWRLRGKQKRSTAQRVLALADLGLHGFRILREPASLKTVALT